MRSICIYSGFCICKLDIVLLESQSKASIILHWFQNMSWKTEVRPRFFFRIRLRNTMACPGFFFFRINLQNTEVRPRPRQNCRSGPVELCLCRSPTWFQRNFINDSLVIKSTNDECCQVVFPTLEVSCSSSSTCCAPHTLSRSAPFSAQSPLLFHPTPEVEISFLHFMDTCIENCCPTSRGS